MYKVSSFCDLVESNRNKMRSSLTLALLIPLLACGTPQQQCIRNATAQTRTLDRLIAASQANLARGYGYRTEQRTRFEWVVCGSYRRGYAPNMCFEPVEDTVTVPEAIDPALEQRKLDNLLAKRAALAKQTTNAIASCKATYPE
jgi:hypothetical protein